MNILITTGRRKRNRNSTLGRFISNIEFLHLIFGSNVHLAQAIFNILMVNGNEKYAFLKKTWLFVVLFCARLASRFARCANNKKITTKVMYSSCVALFYRKRLPQQNGDRRKRDLHAFRVYVGQGRLLVPPPPPHVIRRRALCTLLAPPPSLPMSKN